MKADLTNMHVFLTKIKTELQLGLHAAEQDKPKVSGRIMLLLALALELVSGQAKPRPVKAWFITDATTVMSLNQDKVHHIHAVTTRDHMIYYNMDRLAKVGNQFAFAMLLEELVHVYLGIQNENQTSAKIAELGDRFIAWNGRKFIPKEDPLPYCLKRYS